MACAASKWASSTSFGMASVSHQPMTPSLGLASPIAMPFAVRS